MLVKFCRRDVSILKKYSYILKNLDCANCANKIQEAIAKQEGFENVVVNFTALRLTFETDRKDEKQVITDIINGLEPEVEIIETQQIDAKEEQKRTRPVLRLIIGVILAIIGGVFTIPKPWDMLFIFIAYIVLLYRTAKNAGKLLIKNHTINENFLITISCIGAYLVGEHMEGLMVIILYEIGKILEEKAVNKSRKAISELINIKPEYANLKKQDTYQKVYPDQVKVGEIILIKQGEKVPLDGKIIEGKVTLDMAALTGESNYVGKKEGEEVLSGSIVIEGTILVKVTKEYKNSTVSKILELVENATDKKAKTETFVAKAAKIYTPAVFGLAICVAVFMPIIVQNITYQESIYRALIFLVISCPCAIAISVPLSYFSGIGRASKQGILVKGSDYLDGLKQVKKIVFDKTGTLTTGKFEVSEIKVIDDNYTQNQILDLVAKAEKFSNHPIAKSILEMITDEIDTTEITEFKEIPGKGLSYEYHGSIYKIGNYSKEKKIGTIISLLKDDQPIGEIILKDKIKTESKNVMKQFKRMGITTYMFTGDNKQVAEQVANKIGITNFKAEMLPQDKYEEVEKMIKNQQEGKVAFVGDGINDSPVLALSDVGISMGGVGQQAAIEASDIVIMTDNLEKIVEAINISRKTVKIIKQNLIFAIGTKVLVLILSTIGMAGMWQAIFADVGVTLITILNTLRILNKF